jgi:phytoene synthase
MQQADLLTEHAPKPASDAYYALVFTSRQARVRLTALFAFARYLRILGTRPKDPDVARRQLEWWMAETSPSRLPSSQHPFLQGMLTHGESRNPIEVLSRALQAYVQSAQNELTQSRYLDRAALTNQLLASYGAKGLAIAILGDTPPAGSEAANALHTSARLLGLAWGLGQVIVNLQKDAQLGTVYLPVSELQRAPLRAHELLKAMTGELDVSQQQAISAPFQTLLRSHITWFETVRADALAQATRVDLRILKPLLILLALTRRRFIQWELTQSHEHSLFLEPSPLSKMWVAWKIQALGRY